MLSLFYKDFKDFYKTDLCIACSEPIINNAYLFSQVLTEDLTGKVNVYVCKKCGLAYAHPFLNIADEKKLYEDYFAHHKHEDIASNKIMLRFKFQESIDNLFAGVFFRQRSAGLKKALSCFLMQRVLVAYPLFSCSKNKPLKILDIGCGDGHFLSKAKHFNCVCYGTEYHATLVKRLNAEGIIAETDIRKFISGIKDNNDKFDIVRINWVLEHVLDPGSIIDSAGQLLKDGGELIIGVPSFNTPARIFKENFQMHLPQHRQLFTKKSISSLLEKHGFKVIFYRTKSIGIIGPTLARKFKLNNIPLSFRIVDLFFSILFDIFNCGDCIEIYARKTR